MDYHVGLVDTCTSKAREQRQKQRTHTYDKRYVIGVFPQINNQAEVKK